MKQNKVTERQEITMDIELYRCKLQYLQKVKSYKDIIGIKLKGLSEDYNLNQDNLPFNMQMEINILIKDSIDYYQHQIEFLTQLLNTKNLLENGNN